MRKIHILIFQALSAFLLFSVGLQFVEARHNTSSLSREINKLDDDPVEKFHPPVLFGIDLEAVRPDFGDPRGGGTRSHEGQDMLVPKGTPVVTPTEAVVTRTGNGVNSGLYVRTANPGGEQFVYMHLDKIADIERGDVLDVGDVIGYVGDTGNAVGTDHLHFEVRDEKNRATDPHPRLTNGFTLEEKMSFVEDIFRDRRDDEEYADFLVETFTDDIKAALREGHDLPRVLEDALEDAGIVSTVSLIEKLESILHTIPDVVSTDLALEESGPRVGLVQTYLMYFKTGEAYARLRQAGATGYYGPITESAVAAYQTENKLPVTGIYDAATRAHMKTQK